jgi:serine/threonine protein kinase
MPGPILIDDFDAEASVSMTWDWDANGTLRHRDSGLRVSPDHGIEVDGHEYRLSPADIEVERDEPLGHGTGGVVQAGIHKPTGTRVAIKTVKVDSKAKKEQMLNEIKGLIQAEGCPSLVQWYAGFASKDVGAVHVVVELMDLGSLADLKRRLGGRPTPPAHLARIASQVAEGLHHLHSRSTLHRDVKPENILHNRRGEVKLTDFGISKALTSSAGEVAATFVGTATYMSPERALGQDYSFPSDIWSTGMVAYELACGRYPFTAASFIELYQCLCVEAEPRLDPAEYPPMLCDFVAQCLTREASRRPSAEAILAHEFISEGVEDQVSFADWLAGLE